MSEISQTLETEYVFKMKEFCNIFATLCISLSNDPEPVLYKKLTSLKPHGSGNCAIISFTYISLGKLCVKF
jgi:hypothetical protein